MTTSDSSPSGALRVSLNNADLWQKFYPNNEMKALKAGRKLFPNLDVKIEGLVPDELYAVSFYLERVDNIKYTFSKITGQWKETKIGNEILPIDKKQHKDGGMNGAHWMNSPVSFSYIRITHDPDYKKSLNDDLIFVPTMHKYQPVITVKKLSDGKEEEFRLTMTEFMVVTVYRNRAIAELKNNFNKFSPKFVSVTTPFRPNRPKKRAIISDPIPTAPGPAPPSTDTVTPQVGSPVSSPAKKRTPPSLRTIHHQNQMSTSPITSPLDTSLAPTVAPIQKRIKVEPASSPFKNPVTTTPSSMDSNNLQIRMKTSPALSPSPVAPDRSQKQVKAEPVSPPSTPPPAMASQSPLKNSPAASPTPADFQNQMMAPPNMAPPSMGSNNFQNPMLIPPVMAYPLPYMAPLAYNFQFWNPHGMPNVSQFPMVPMPPPQQWNMMYGPGNMPQFGIPGFPQYPNNFNGAGPSSQQGLNNGNFYNGY